MLSGQLQPKEQYATSLHGNKWNSSWKPEEDIAVSTAALCDSVQRSTFLFKHDIPLCLDVKFVFSNKNTWYGCPQPNLDNLCKIVMDALNGIVYQDDNQFVKLVAEKRPAKHMLIELSLLFQSMSVHLKMKMMMILLRLWLMHLVCSYWK